MKMLFCNVANMKNYQGVNDCDIPVGGGRFVNKNRFGYECNNYLEREDGNCYGFVETGYNPRSWREKDGKNLNIDRIVPGKGSYKFVDGVRIVFVSGNKIIGWYDNARVYPERQYLKGDRSNPYYFRAASENCHIIPDDERVMMSFRAKNNNVGFGQSNVWYADRDIPDVHSLKKKVNDYIDQRLACVAA